MNIKMIYDTADFEQKVTIRYLMYKDMKNGTNIEGNKADIFDIIDLTDSGNNEEDIYRRSKEYLSDADTIYVITTTDHDIWHYYPFIKPKDIKDKLFRGITPDRIDPSKRYMHTSNNFGLFSWNMSVTDGLTLPFRVYKILNIIDSTNPQEIPAALRAIEMVKGFNCALYPTIDERYFKAVDLIQKYYHNIENGYTLLDNYLFDQINLEKLVNKLSNDSWVCGVVNGLIKP